MNTIRIKCPVCGAILNAKDDPSNVKKSVTCPNCKERRKFTEFKVIVPVAPAAAEAGQEPVADETQVCIRRRPESSPGYLLDKATGLSYPIPAGEHFVGRKTSKSPSKADIAIETTDRGMSRLHLKVLCSLAQDGRYHVSVSNAENKNPTLVNGETLVDGDVVGIKHGDILTLCETRLEFVGNPVEDRTELNVNKK